MSEEHESLDEVQLAIQMLRRSRMYPKAAVTDKHSWFWDVKPQALLIEGKAYILGEDNEYHDWPKGAEVFVTVFGEAIIDLSFTQEVME